MSARWYFQWADDFVVGTSQPTMTATDDEQMLSLEISRARGGITGASVTLATPWRHLTGAARQASIDTFFARSAFRLGLHLPEDDRDTDPVRLMFQGRLQSWPDAWDRNEITIEALAKASDHEDRLRTFHEAHKTAPAWDELTVDLARLSDPAAGLEGRTQLILVDRRTGKMRHEETVAFPGAIVDYDLPTILDGSVQVRLSGSPLSRLRIVVTCAWTQTARGVVDCSDRVRVDGFGGAIATHTPVPLKDSWPDAGELGQSGWTLAYSDLQCLGRPNSYAAPYGHPPGEIYGYISVGGAPAEWVPTGYWTYNPFVFRGDLVFTYDYQQSRFEQLTLELSAPLQQAFADDDRVATLQVNVRMPSTRSSQGRAVTAVGNPSGGSVALADGLITVTPPAGFTGDVTFDVTETDTITGAEITGPHTVTVTGGVPVVLDAAALVAGDASPYPHWQADRAYAQGELVRHAGVVWRALSAHTESNFIARWSADDPGIGNATPRWEPVYTISQTTGLVSLPSILNDARGQQLLDHVLERGKAELLAAAQCAQITWQGLISELWDIETGDVVRLSYPGGLPGDGTATGTVAGYSITADADGPTRVAVETVHCVGTDTGQMAAASRTRTVNPPVETPVDATRLGDPDYAMPQLAVVNAASEQHALLADEDFGSGNVVFHPTNGPQWVRFPGTGMVFAMRQLTGYATFERYLRESATVPIPRNVSLTSS